jgi:hypothetical protein
MPARIGERRSIARKASRSKAIAAISICPLRANSQSGSGCHAYSRTRERGSPRAASNCKIAQTATPSNATMAAFMATGASDIRVTR